MERRNGKKILYASIVIFSVLTACVDEELISGSDNDFLKIEVYDENIYGTEDELSRAEYSGLHTDFEEGDAIGVYAVKGTSTVSSNVKFVLTDGVWIPQTKVAYNPDYTYYAYFPYTSSPYSPSFSSSSLDAKFANFISDSSNKFWKANQSTKGNFTASNLMISQGVAGTNKTVKFTMQHKRALAIIGGLKNTWCYDTDPDTEYPVYTEFLGNIPFTNNGIKYFLMKPGVNTSVGGITINGSSGKYTQSAGGEITGNFRAEYSTSKDGGETWSKYSTSEPDWLTVTTIQEDDKPVKFVISTTDEKTTDLVVGPFEKTRDDVPVKQATPVIGVCDLSMINNDGTPRTNGMTTANCYLVHAPGNYKLPLVYGNAIKNGVTNTAAYHTDLSGDGVLADFVNHNNTIITDPWLKNNGITVDGAELVWQDAQGLISSVDIDGDYLTFTVSKDNIVEGNAVIAAKQGNTIVWSWHIWVTTETFSNSDLIELKTTSHTYKIAPVNLGHIFVSYNGTIYQGAKVRVKIQTNLCNCEFECKQKDNLTVDKYGVTCTTYQWGRKDAIMPALPMCFKDNRYSQQFPKYKIDGQTTYIIDGNGVSSINSESGHIGVTIKYPNYFFKYDPYYLDVKNAWNVNKTSYNIPSEKTYKTIYDPCPPDFCVFPVNILTHLTGDESYNGTGEKSQTYNRDIEYIDSSDGYHYNSIIYLDSNTKMKFYNYIYYGSSCELRVGYLLDNFATWSDTSYDSKRSRFMLLSSYIKYTYINKASSLPVRPVAEEE